MARHQRREQYDIYITGSNAYGQLFKHEAGYDISTFRLRLADQPPLAYKSFDILYIDSGTTVTLIDDIITSEGRQRQCARMPSKPRLGTAFGHPDIGMLGFVDEQDRLNLVQRYPLPGHLRENWDITPAAPYGLERNALVVTAVLPQAPKLGLVAMNVNGNVVCTLEGRAYEENRQAGADQDEEPHAARSFESLEKFMIWYAQGGQASEAQPKSQWNLSSKPLQLLTHGISFLLLLNSGVVRKLIITDEPSSPVQPQVHAPNAQLPETISGLQDVLIEKIAAGSQYAAALSRQGELYIWSLQPQTDGDHSASFETGPLGMATSASIHSSSSGCVPGILDVTVGSSHIALVSTDHRLFVIGHNDRGQLGLYDDHTNPQQSQPDWIEIKQIKNVHRVVCAPDATIAFTRPRSVPSGEYDEDEIVELVSSIYRTAIRMGMFEAHEVTFAPPQGHEIDTSQLENASDLDSRCVSLMKRLPYAPAGYRSVVLDMECVDYRSPDTVRRTRYIDHPVMLTSRPEHEWLERKARPVDMFLFHGREGDDPSLVLDVESNFIRYFGSDVSDHLPEGAYDRERRAQHSDEYLYWPAEHAPTYLKRILAHMNNGDWIPDCMGGYLPTEGSGERPWAAKLKDLFLNEFKWPSEDFRRADWLRDGGSVVQRILEEGDFY